MENLEFDLGDKVYVVKKEEDQDGNMIYEFSECVISSFVGKEPDLKPFKYKVKNVHSYESFYALASEIRPKGEKHEYYDDYMLKAKWFSRD